MPRSIFALLCLLVAACTAPAAERPNVVFIMADDLGYSDLGCYGSEISTPNLDGLAKEGLRFTQFYNTARCWPSRSVTLSGYYAQAIRRDTVEGVQSGGRGVRPAWAPLLPATLKSAGYRSYHSGKWHVDGKPLENGFDHSYLVENHNDHFSTKGNSEDGVPVESRDDYYSATATADHAIKYLKEHAEKHADQPFFAYVAFIEPHFPLHAPAEDVAKYRDRYKDGWNVMQAARYERQLAMKLVASPLPAMERGVGPPYAFPKDVALLGPGEVNRPLPWTELTSEQRDFQAAKMAVHAAMVDRMDQEIGRVIAQLKAMGQLDNTVIFFAADNGASAEMMVRGNGHDATAPLGSGKTFLCLGPGWSSSSNTPFRRHKTWTHEGGISTPLIVHWPKGISARGELRTNPGHLVDIVPTVLDLAGAKSNSPVPLHGKSLVPAFAKDNSAPHDFLWWQHEGNRALRVGDMKIVASGKDAPWELYDLAKDRGETNNLADTQPQKARELAQIWTQHYEEYRALALKDAPPPTPGKGGKKNKSAAE